VSRSYHDTQKSALKALLYLGDTEPGYRVSEKHWVKDASREARKPKRPKINRAIVAEEKRQTAARKEKREAVYTYAYGFVSHRKKAH
jgi:hypothetical protein